MNIVKFDYVDDFHCIGPECTDSCCKYWRIDLSKREYLNYKKMDCSAELRSAVDGAFQRIKGGSELTYVNMKLKEDGSCPFLGKDSLCMLQKEMSEEALSFTCKIFPRLNMNVGNGETVVKTCTVTCSHVVEMLINKPEGLRVIEEPYDGKDRFINSNRYSAISVPKTWKGYPAYWNIISAGIDALQNRNFTIPERMLIFGYFCQKAEEYVNNNEMEKIPPLAEMLLDNELCTKIADSLKPSQSDHSAATKSMDIIFQMYRHIKTCNMPHVEEMFEQVIKALDFTYEEQPDGLFRLFWNREKYEKLCETYKNIEKERPYITENLLVNLLLGSNLSEGIWKIYVGFAVFYNTLKICVPAFLSEEWNDRELAKAITYAVKMTFNTHLAQDMSFHNLVANNTYTLPYMAFLIS